MPWTRPGRSACAVAAVVVVVAGSVGCARDQTVETSRRKLETPSAAPLVVEQRQVQSDGAARSYRLFSPDSARDKRAPLVIALHGGGNTGASLVGTTQFDRAAAAHGFLVAYPEGLNRGWDGGFCCTADHSSRPGDVAFLGRLIDDVRAIRRVDDARVFAVGVSNGAVMAYRLGCEIADRLAGIGSVAGAMLLDGCQPSRPLSVIEIHGTEDPLVPFSGGAVRPTGVATSPAPPTESIIGFWATRDGCAEPPEVDSSGAVRTTTWSQCSAGARVRLVAVEGGGHNWFAPELGDAAGAIDATAALVEFFGLGAS